MSRFLVLLTLISVCVFSSCIMRKVQYVKNMSPDSLYNIKAAQALKIQKGDRLSIIVQSKNEELAAPFNTSLGGYNLKTESKVVEGVNTVNTISEGYLVDNDGEIDFPILGKIKVDDLSMDEIGAHISSILIKNNYISDANVEVKLLNFKIMTMGTISNSILKVPDGKITLLEAIVRSGGLTVGSDAQNVRVIRESNGERKLLMANLEDYDMFNSEAYYLQQNDIVYVQNKYKQLDPGTQAGWSIFTMLLGSASIILTSLVLLKR